MIWQNPWAFIGLLALAIPVVIHLLGRRSARVRRFPSLRFVAASQPISIRRTRLEDVPLLIVRLGILAVAVAALARPLLLTADRERDLGRALARAIVVDTSASMSRQTAAGERAVTVARSDARRLADEASPSVVVETAAVAGSIPGAVAWLETRPGRRELVIISDFQTGALDGRDLAAVPPGMGIELVRMAIAAAGQPIEAPVRALGVPGVARITLDSTRTAVEWALGAVADPDAVAPVGGASPASAAGDEPLVLAGAAERPRAEAARTAALRIVPERQARERPIAIVHRSFEQRATLVRDARPIAEPWQGDVVARLARDADVVRTMESASAVPDSLFDASNRVFALVARSADGTPAVLAARGTVDGRDRLLLFFQGDAGSVASAALVAGAVRAGSTAPPAAELEPGVIPEEALAAWRRAPATVTASDTESGESDGRWLWIAALVLFGVETWMRRRLPRNDRAVDSVNARAA